MARTLTAIWLLLFLARGVSAEPRPGEVVIEAVSRPPVVDGSIESELWGEPLHLDPWVSYDPLRGESATETTTIWTTHDDKYLYLAFRCLDSNASGIRTTTSRRDSVFNDDWVGLSLDSMGTGQTSYHLMSNPSGIQMDALNTISAGERWDVDFVWESFGRLTPEGYEVEMRVPLTTLRFKGGSEVRMGILFWRRISRLGVSTSTPAIPAGQWVFNVHNRLVFKNLHPPPLLEFVPAITYSLNQNRQTPTAWSDPSHKGDAGLSAKIGLTPSITLDATINPDFSQVESDTFQVEVNQRFPIFFSEKRPFFMEGMGLFNLAAGGDGDGNLRSAVHTRRIVDPGGGLKLTGSSGRVTFGTLTALDQSPSRRVETRGQEQWFNVGRVIYGLGQSNYAGALFTDTELAGRHNRVIAADAQYRFSSSQALSGAILRSTAGTRRTPSKQGLAAQALYTYDTRSTTVIAHAEHWDRDFAMDTAFFNRTGISTGWLYTAASIYPERGSRFGWIKRIQPFLWQRQGRDLIHDGREWFLMPALRLNLTRQGQFRIDHGWGREPWLGRSYRVDATRIQGGAQWTRWLNTWTESRWGYSPFFDDTAPFQGRSRSSSIRVTLQPTGKLNQNISYNNVSFRREDTDERVFQVHVLNLKTTYLLNRRLSIRALEQWDSSRRRVLLDFLGGYEIGPGTVMFLGYGTLFEKRPWESGKTLVNDYRSTRRGLFFKASYLKRF